MILRHTVTVQSRVLVIGTEGEHTYTFSTLKILYPCDIQPVNASPEELRSWGLVDLVSGSRMMFYKHDTTIQTCMRIVHGVDIYEIRNINPWAIHDRALLVPIQAL